MANFDESKKNLQDGAKAAGATEQAIKNATAASAQLTDDARSLTEELKDQLNIRSSQNEGEKTLLSLSRQITTSAQENKVILREQGDIAKTIKKEVKQLESAERERLILQKTLSKDQIADADKISSANKTRLDTLSHIDRLQQSLVTATESERSGIQSQVKGYQDRLAANEASLDKILSTADAESQRLALANQLADKAQENLGESEKQEAIQNQINDSMGITGNILEGLNELGGGFAKAFKLDKVLTDVKKFTTEAADAGKKVSRLQTLGVAASSALSNAFKTITDPATIITGAIAGFQKLDKVNVDFQRQTGQNLNTMATGAAMANTHFISLGDYIKAASELTKELGINAAAIFGPEDITEVAEMTEAMGLASNEANNLARFSKINGGNIKDQNESIVKGINAANRQNKTAVAHGEVLKDVANVSDSIAISYAGYPDKLASAAATAKGLGMNLEQVDKIAGSLLNFEQSIQAEMEAELLTGRNLNLEKARELALANDLEGVAKELANQGITSANFSQMNRIQQEAQAKALGMSRDEMAKMLLAQEMQNGLQESALNEAQKATLEQLKAEEASHKMSKSIEKIQQVFAPIVEVVADVLGYFAGIVSGAFQLLGYLGMAKPLLIAIGAVAGTIALGMLANKMKGFVTSAKEGLDTVKSIGQGVLNMAKGKGGGLSSIFGGGDKTKAAADSTAEGAGKLSESTQGVKGDKGKEIEKFLKGVGRGLKFIGQNFAQIAAGGLALLLASPGLIALGLASPGLYVLSLINGPSINKALTGLGRGLSNFVKHFGIADAAKFAIAGLLMVSPLVAMGLAYSAIGGDPMVLIGLGIGIAGLAASMFLVGKMQSSIMQGALALAVLGLALIPAAFAFSMLNGLDVDAMVAFSIALPLLALATAGLGFLAPFIMAGAGALAVLGLALIPAGMAFSMLSGLDTKSIISFATTIGILAIEAAALAFIAPFIMFGSLALLTLGLALIPLAQGISMMGAAGGGEIFTGIIELASIAPGLAATAAALFAVAGGMTAVAIAGYLAVPAMALMSLFGGSNDEGGDKKEDEMAKVNSNLERLIALVEAGGDVYIDGAKVGKTLQLSSSKMG